MVSIFLDESGDLGFNFSASGTSKYFVVCILITENKKTLDQLVKKIIRNLPPKQRQKRKGVLHCTNEDVTIRKRLLANLTHRELGIVYICIEKKRILIPDRNQKHLLYNYITNALINKVFDYLSEKEIGGVDFFASRRETNKYYNECFSRFIESNTTKNSNIDLKIHIASPQDEKCLQIVDFLSWSVFRKYEYNDDEYYSIISSKIIDRIYMYK